MSMTRCLSAWTPSLGLALIVLATYSSALPNRWIWDDDAYVTQNQELRSAAGLWRIWSEPSETPQYYPLTHTSFWLETRLWGYETWADGQIVPKPFGFHLDNVILHLASMVLLYRLLRRLDVPSAWLATAVVAVHPIGVESVAWVTERKNVLSGFLALGSALSFLTYVETARLRLLALSALLFAGALLSKTVVASLPAVLFLLLWWKRARISKEILLALLMMLVAGGLMGWYTARLERIHVGATGLEWSWSFADRVLIAGRALWTYFLKLLTPWSLAFMYSRWSVDAGDIWQYAFPLAAALLVIGAFLLRHRLGRAPIATFLIYGGALFPALGFLNVYPHRYSFVADHFQHHAAIAMLVFLVACGSKLVSLPQAQSAFNRITRLQRPLSLGAPGALLLALSYLTWLRCHAYESAETLWRDTIERTPSASIAYNNLGNLEISQWDEQGNRKAPRLLVAVRLFEKAVESDPDNQLALNNLGLTQMNLKRYQQAERVFRQAIERRPGYFQSHINLGSLLVVAGREEEATIHMEHGNELSPTGPIPSVCASLGTMYLDQGRHDLAEQRLSIAYQAQFSHPDLHLDYARALHRTGKTQEAIWMYELAAQRKAKSAEAALELIWILSSHENSQLRSMERARKLADQLLQHREAWIPAVLDAAASAYANAGDFDQAIHWARHAEKTALATQEPAEGIVDRLRLYESGVPYRSELGLR